MMERRIYDIPGHVHFVTFSCYKKRRYLDHPRARQIVIGELSRHLPRWDGVCFGFVIMPDHVHALLGFNTDNRLSRLMNVWKGGSSGWLKKHLHDHRTHYSARIGNYDAIWQRRYYDFNVTTEEKGREKLNYMHNNPVRKALAETPCDWPHSSARWYEEGESVGVSLRAWASTR